MQHTAGGFGDKLNAVAGALETYMVKAAEIVKQLETLREQARVFVESVKGHDSGIETWRKDPDKVAEHKAIWDGVNAAIAAFEQAEVTCADKITALVGGTQWHINNGKPGQKNAYGFSAGQLAQAEKLPWGSPEHEEMLPYGIDYHLKQAGISFWDNAKGSVTGLIDLFSPGDEGNATREGLVRVIAGGAGYLLDPYGDRNTHLGPASDQLMEDGKPYAKQFAKSFVAWDDWQTNPGKAFGTVLFNGITLGSGPLGAASRAGAAAGEAGAAARVLGTVAKVGEVLDPIGAATKAVGVAARTLPKVSDLVSGVRAATEAATTADKAHSFLEYPNGSHLRIEDGQFIPGKHGVTDATPAPHEPAADDRAPSIKNPRHHELVGAGARAPEADARAGESLPPQAHHEAGTSHKATGGAEASSGHEDAHEHHAASGHGTGDGHHPPSPPAEAASSGEGGVGHHSPAGQGGGPPNGHQPAPVKEWKADDNIVGPARGKTLLYPNSRHDLSGVKGGVPDDKNTVILPETKEKVRQDIAEIAAGRAQFEPEGQRYTVNGRRYAVEPHGRIFPVDGPGFVEMNRVEYTALKHIMKANGDLSKLQVMFSKAPQFRENPQAVEKAIELYRKYYP
ncbi:hypothetical protein ACWDBP_47335 [Streptomyces sp. NPDC001233]|uniref:hypothetical protein n=1 Tax=Streptomyces sp. NPDC002589 TaxID=3154420 RepID=UPI0033203315